MAEEITYMHYSTEDIERYILGRMNAKEMHALERAALQDPFLADAIEGYGHAPFAQTYKHLDEITANILGEKKPAKIVALPVKANYWWQVAVVVGFVLVIGGVLLLLGKNNEPANNPIAATMAPKPQKAPVPSVSKTPAKESKQDIAKMANEDFGDKKTTRNITKVPATEKVETVALEPVDAQQPTLAEPVYAALAKPKDSIVAFTPSTPLPNKEEEILSRGRAKVAIVANTPDSLLVSDKFTVASGIKITANNAKLYNNPASQSRSLKSVFVNNNAIVLPSAQPNGLQGYVVDDKQQALSNATVYSSKGRQMALTDNNGYFKFNTADTQLAVGVSAAGYETRQLELRNNAANYIVVNQTPATLANKVELVKLGNKHKTAKRQAVDSLFPEGGWQSFREYAYKKMHREKEMDTTAEEATYLGGTVEVEFTVDENGIARDLKITQSLNEKIDAKALAVVQQWPRWIATRKNKVGKVVIHY